MLSQETIIDEIARLQSVIGAYKDLLKRGDKEKALDLPLAIFTSVFANVPCPSYLSPVQRAAFIVGAVGMPKGHLVQKFAQTHELGIVPLKKFYDNLTKQARAYFERSELPYPLALTGLLHGHRSKAEKKMMKELRKHAASFEFAGCPPVDLDAITKAAGYSAQTPDKPASESNVSVTPPDMSVGDASERTAGITQSTFEAVQTPPDVSMSSGASQAYLQEPPQAAIPAGDDEIVLDKEAKRASKKARRESRQSENGGKREHRSGKKHKT